MPGPDAPAVEAERQLAAAADRHHEVLAAVQADDGSIVSREAATRALARGVQLVAFTLARAAQAGVPFERLVELSGWDEGLVRETLDRGAAATVVARMTPARLDANAVAQAAASFEATSRVEAVLRTILADVGDDAWSPAGADLDDLADRVEAVWRSWRQGLGRQDA